MSALAALRDYQERTDREIPVVLLSAAEVTIVWAMVTFADIALETTIVYILIWGILFPAFVTGLIVYSVIMGRGDGESNEENRRYPRL